MFPLVDLGDRFEDGGGDNTKEGLLCLPGNLKNRGFKSATIAKSSFLKPCPCTKTKWRKVATAENIKNTSLF